MYQFYYAGKEQRNDVKLNKKVEDYIDITAVRPTTWEEHCLECGATQCYLECRNYTMRQDGRCRLFENSIAVFPEERAVNGVGTHLRYKKNGNMMSIIFPGYFSLQDYRKQEERWKRLGGLLRGIAAGPLSPERKWKLIHHIEKWNRKKMREIPKEEDASFDAFVFHGYSFYEKEFQLCIEVYDRLEPKFRTGIKVVPGENLMILPAHEFTEVCWEFNYLVKVYPENNEPVDLEIYWCDFVRGKRKKQDRIKCVVWDLDNTIWQGILAEVNEPSELKLQEHIVEMIRDLDSKGIIHSIASKNDEKQAMEVLDQFGIKDYFLYPQIHMNAKSGSIECIAQQLNIGLDAIAFFDDTETERAEVHFRLPQVHVFDVNDIRQIIKSPLFDVIATEESRHRRRMYQEEACRREYKQVKRMDNVEFLKDCNIQIQIFHPVRDTSLLRSFELLQRTNQLNLSGRKYSYEEFRENLQKKDVTNLAADCRDRFGSYGICCFLQYRKENNRLVFMEFAMSCRVAGKYLESALFEKILEKEQVEEGCFTVTKTKKNSLLVNSLENIGFIKIQEDHEKVDYIFRRNLKHNDIVDAEFTIEQL